MSRSDDLWVKMPTKEQVKEYIEYVNGLEVFSHIHGIKFEGLPNEKQKELQIVGKWLKALGE